MTLLLLVPRTLGAKPPPLLPRSATWLPPTREVPSSVHCAAAAFDPHSDDDVISELVKKSPYDRVALVMLHFL